MFSTKDVIREAKIFCDTESLKQSIYNACNKRKYC